MKKLFLSFAIAALLSTSLYAQSTLHFTINQPPILEVDAGKDTVVKKGSLIKIGGLFSARGGSGNYQYSWFPTTSLDKMDIPNPIAKIDSTITYTLSVNDGRGCIKISQITVKVSDIIIIDPTTSELNLKVFPNPSKGTFVIASDLAIPDLVVNIEVYDSQGRLVLQKNTFGNRRMQQLLVIKGAKKGLYFLKISSNSLNTTFKILIH